MKFHKIKVNQHFVDQAIVRAGITEPKATELFYNLVRILNRADRHDYIKKVITVGNNRTLYMFMHNKDKTGYFIADNLKKRPITYVTKEMANRLKKENENG